MCVVEIVFDVVQEDYLVQQMCVVVPVAVQVVLSLKQRVPTDQDSLRLLLKYVERSRFTRAYCQYVERSISEEVRRIECDGGSQGYFSKWRVQGPRSREFSLFFSR